MLRALALGAALWALGCGDDTTTGPVDLAQPVFDLTIPGLHCGVNTCAGSCAVCFQVAGGLCEIPCTMANPSSCTTGTCMPLVPDGGNGDGESFVGDCAGYDGYCG